MDEEFVGYILFKFNPKRQRFDVPPNKYDCMFHLINNIPSNNWGGKKS